ncbi:MAG: DEAD/DEAH box helicase [Pirellulaceae bacterium]
MQGHLVVMNGTPTRDDIAAEFFEKLPFEPYPVQEEAMLAWFTSPQGVLVCAPTGTGKTLIAEAAIYEALRTGKRIYYTTPLIALTDQKFTDIQEAAQQWGFSADDIGLVTGNRRVNPDAKVLVVVAEILFNRLLQGSDEFKDVFAVVMDEFHNFNDPERGMVWELSLGLLPAHTRLLLLSATVGNAFEFVRWLDLSHNHRLQLVEGKERKVPLSYQWVGDELLADFVETLAAGGDEVRRTPALVFCFNRDICWSIAEMIKGKKVLFDGQKKQISVALEKYDFNDGAGPKLKQLLMRGVGVHHAGVLPKYRRIVEDFFQQKLLSFAVCTETLAAGINLPARSVIVPNLLKGPPGDKKLLDPSSAHQMFGRAGRPQFDTHGYVYALAHEDDVKILRWQVKYDQIPEDTKDPGLRKAKKALKKKMPKRRSTEQYWREGQFEQLQSATPRKLSSRGVIPWRLLAHMLNISSDVKPLRELVSKRLLPEKALQRAAKVLDGMLLTLSRAGYIELEPQPPWDDEQAMASYRAELAQPTDRLDDLLHLRSVNPLYGVFLTHQLGIADRGERLQALESLLELPGSLGPAVRVPHYDVLPAGPLAMERLDPRLLQLGLATVQELTGEDPDEEEDRSRMFAEERPRVLKLADKLLALFEHDFPGVHDVRIRSVWVAGEVFEYGTDFNKYITSNRLQRQEGVVFRHLLRMMLLCTELEPLTPLDADEAEWLEFLRDTSSRLSAICRNVDPASTDKALQQAASSRGEV